MATKMQPVIIIPARYESTRFPGKPLALIDGLPMIGQVILRAIAMYSGHQFRHFSIKHHPDRAHARLDSPAQVVKHLISPPFSLDSGKNKGWVTLGFPPSTFPCAGLYILFSGLSFDFGY
jgi:hypothetical protein